MSETVQVAVVGAGPAGLSAAIAASRAGAQVVLFDENATAGGQLRYRSAVIDGIVGGGNPAHLAETLTREATEAGVDIRTDVRVWGLFRGNVIGVENNSSSTVLGFERLVLASGSVDRAAPFPGGSLPGVFTARALQLLLNVYRVRPGRRFAVIGSDAVVAELSRDIQRSGGEVVVTFPSVPDDLAVTGLQGVQHMTGNGSEFPVDVVVIGIGRLPDAGLATMAECLAGFDPEFGAFVPLVDGELRTSVPTLFAAGDCLGPCGIRAVLAEGAFAGLSVAGSLGLVGQHELMLARLDYIRNTGGRAGKRSRVKGSFDQIDRVAAGATAG